MKASSVAPFFDDFTGFVESNPWITLDVHHFYNLDSGILAEREFVAIQPFHQVRLSWHGEDHDVTLTVDLLGRHTASHHARLVVVGANEQQPLTAGRVGVQRDHRNSRADGCVDVALQKRRIGC